MLSNFKKTTIKSLFSMIYALSLCSQNKAMDDHPYKEYEDLKIGIDYWNEKAKTYFDKPLRASNIKVKLLPKDDEFDKDQCAESYKRAFNNEGRSASIRKDLDSQEYNLNSGKFKSGNAYICTYYIKDKSINKEIPVSFAIISRLEKPYPNNDKGIYDIIDFWTDPNYQSNGYGEKLLDFIIDKAYKENA